MVKTNNLIKKWINNLNRFLKKCTQMANKDIKGVQHDQSLEKCKLNHNEIPFYTHLDYSAVKNIILYKDEQ